MTRNHTKDTFPTMMTAYGEYLLACNRSEGTVLLRLGDLDRFQRAMRGRNLLDLNLEDLRSYMAANRKHAAETKKNLRASLALFYSWCEDTGRISSNPALKLEPISIPRTVPRIASDDAIIKALKTADDEVSAMILLARAAALRLNEITTLHTDNVKNDVIRVTGKGERVRFVTCNEDLRPALTRLELKNGPGYYFRPKTTRSTLPHVHKHTVYKWISSSVGYNPHALRHRAATEMYAATGDLIAVMALLGHSSPATTLRYLHTAFDQLKAATDGGRLFKQPVTPSTPPALFELEPQLTDIWADFNRSGLLHNNAAYIASQQQRGTRQ